MSYATRPPVSLQKVGDTDVGNNCVSIHSATCFHPNCVLVRDSIWGAAVLKNGSVWSSITIIVNKQQPCNLNTPETLGQPAHLPYLQLNKKLHNWFCHCTVYGQSQLQWNIMGPAFVLTALGIQWAPAMQTHELYLVCSSYFKFKVLLWASCQIWNLRTKVRVMSGWIQPDNQLAGIY